MTQMTTIGLDLAKSVFQVHGIDERGKVRVRKQLRRKEERGFFSQLAPLSSGAGSVWECPLLGTGVGGVGPYGEVNIPAVCEAVCEE